MCGIGNYGAASEFHEARHDFREARQETREARQHFAEAREQFSEARQDFAHGNILGGIAHTIAGRRELAEERQDLADASGPLRRISAPRSHRAVWTRPLVSATASAALTDPALGSKQLERPWPQGTS